jgi:hypothetical protein
MAVINRLRCCAPAASIALAALVALLLGGALAHAQPHERSVDLAQGSFTLRASVVQSTDISAVTAREHGITPGPGTGVLNVTLFRHDGERREPVAAAQIDAQVRDLFGTPRSVALQPVSANPGVSYFAGFKHEPAEVLDFTIRATAGPSAEPIELSFRERLGAPRQ